MTTMLRPGQRILHVPGIGISTSRRAVSVGGAAAWWLEGGIAAANAVAAYQPKGAASLAASYSNLANPGTYDAAPGTAPTWNSTDGWIGDGTRYLTTGISPSNTWSYIARISGVTANAPFGSRAGIGNQEVWIVPAIAANSLWSNGARTTAGTTYPTGIVAIADRSRYFNGSFIASDIPAQTFTSTYPLLLCAWSNAGTPNGFTGKIQAIAFYNTTLTAPQVAAVSAAMAAL